VKYIGDAIFAFWNAPELQGDHAVRACDAALRFREMSSQEVRGKKLITRIGLHTGVANVGNFGSETRVDYTAIGEDVNLASRMEGLNKYLGTTVLMTGAVKAEIGDKFATRFLGRFQLKGFERAVDVYELLGSGSPAANGEFAHALEFFTKRDFASAEAAFNRMVQTNSDDGPAKFYLKHLGELHGHEFPPNWNGEVELKEK
jgi:adenylate cyclase